MKVLPAILFMISIPVFGQGKISTDSGSVISYLQQIVSEDNRSAAIESFQGFVSKLEKKQTGLREKEFLQLVFTKTHQAYLKHYVAYASVDNLFTDGSYHCLTGTVLYSLILTELGIDHEVIETNYHIFLIAQTTEGEVLIETTDPASGFVDSPLEIEQRISSYKLQNLEASNAKLSYYKFNTAIFNRVDLSEMKGLLYYNNAVDLFNQKKLKESVHFLVKANQYYSSSRIDEFSQILLLTLQQSSLEYAQKKEYMKALVALRQNLVPMMAVLN